MPEGDYFRTELSPTDTRYMVLGEAPDVLTYSYFGRKLPRLIGLNEKRLETPDALSLRMVLLTGDDPRRSILKSLKGVRLEADRRLGDRPVRSLYLDVAAVAPDLRLLIDADSMILRVEYEHDAEAMKRSLPFVDEVKTYAWDAGRVETAADPEWFSFRPDAHAKKVESFLDLITIYRD